VSRDGRVAAPAGSWHQSDGGVVAFLAFVGMLMAFGIDASLPAFDELRADFDLDDRGISPAIVGTPYFVGAAVGQLAFGVLADRFGRRSTLIIGFVLYGAAAAACAASTELWVLVAMRFVWGIGAAAPSVLRFAIARDLYSGDRLARVITTFSAVFLLGPIFAPFAGEALVSLGSWRTVFLFGAPLSAVALVWTIGFGETLAPEHRRPLRFSPIVDGFRAVVATPVTRWVMIGQVFNAGAFFIWLGSAQPIIGQVYNLDDRFTLVFAISGVGMAIALFLNRRLIDRFGTHQMIRSASISFVVVTSVGVVIALVAGGRPAFALWLGWAVLANASSTVITPMSASIALEPMADKAGTASALLGMAQFGLGALLAAVVDAQVGDTVTPMLVGALLYGVVALIALLKGLAAVDGRSQPPNVAPSPSHLLPAATVRE